MKFQIKNWKTGEIIFELEATSMRLCIEAAIKASANLSSANLHSANLHSAVGVNKDLTTPLRILLEQPGPIWAYKLVNAEGEGPFNGGINYLNTEIEDRGSYEKH